MMDSQDLSEWVASLPSHWIKGCSAPLFDEAHALYRSAGRFYHTWDHVVACVETLRGFRCESPRETFLALVFHDGIYIPGDAGNERRSADVAAGLLRRYTSLASADIALVERMIVATRDHAAASEHDVRVVLDIDMSILAAPRDRYEAYAEAIASEYAPVMPRAQFLEGRKSFLRRLLAPAPIYQTPEGLARWEQPARQNVAQELERLRAAPAP